MAKKSVPDQWGIPIHQDFGRIKYPIGKDGKVTICGKKKTLSPAGDVKKYKPQG